MKARRVVRACETRCVLARERRVHSCPAAGIGPNTNSTVAGARGCCCWCKRDARVQDRPVCAFPRGCCWCKRSAGRTAGATGCCCWCKRGARGCCWRCKRVVLLVQDGVLLEQEGCKRVLLLVREGGAAGAKVWWCWCKRGARGWWCWCKRMVLLVQEGCDGVLLLVHKGVAAGARGMKGGMRMHEGCRRGCWCKSGLLLVEGGAAAGAWGAAGAMQAVLVWPNGWLPQQRLMLRPRPCCGAIPATRPAPSACVCQGRRRCVCCSSASQDLRVHR